MYTTDYLRSLKIIKDHSKHTKTSMVSASGVVLHVIVFELKILSLKVFGMLSIRAIIDAIPQGLEDKLTRRNSFPTVHIWSFCKQAQSNLLIKKML